MSATRIIIRRTSLQNKDAYVFDICSAPVAALPCAANPAPSPNADNSTPIATSLPYASLPQAHDAALAFANSIHPAETLIERAPSITRANSRRGTTPAKSARDMLTAALTQRAAEVRRGITNCAARPYYITDLLAHETRDGSPLTSSALFDLFDLDADSMSQYDPASFYIYRPRIRWRLLDQTYFEHHWPTSMQTSQCFDPADLATRHNNTLAGSEAFDLPTSAATGAPTVPNPCVRVQLHGLHYRLAFKQLVWLLYAHDYAHRIHFRHDYFDWQPDTVHIGSTRPKHWDTPA